MKGWGKFNSANKVDVDMTAGGTEQITAKNIMTLIQFS